MTVLSRPTLLSALVGLCAAATLVAMPTGAALHLRLERSEPMADSTVASAPTAIRLWFSQPPELNVTSVRLTGEDGRVAGLGALTRARESTAPVVAPVQGMLAAGRYIVAWRTMSRDGHVVSGTFGFTVAGTPSHQH